MSQPTTIANLPVELVAIILDLFRGDRRALCAFSLTCKLWLEEARRVLLFSVDLDNENIRAFCDTITTRPELAGYIRELTLNGVKRTAKPPTSLRTPNVRLLRLVGMDTSHPWVRAVHSACKLSVRMLSLRDYRTDSIDTLVTFLQEMPRLRNIEMDGDTVREVHDFSDGSNIVNAPDLQSLSLNATTVAVVHALISCPLAFKKLTIVKIHLENAWLPAFNAFLQVVGNGLRELDLGIGCDMTNAFGFGESSLTLASCSNLRFFKLAFKLCAPNGAIDHLSYVPAILATLRASELRRAKFVVKAIHASLEDLKAVGWERVGSILNQKNFTSLSQVIVHLIDGYGLRERAMPLLFEQLAILHTQGVLRCVHRF